MNISVCICTWNRSALLQQALESMTRLRIPDGTSWELIIVDNNSTDDTQQVAAKFVKRIPLRLHFEPKSGKSHALNRAMVESTGEFIIWTDDDVIVDSEWLAAYVEAIHKYPAARFFGGRADPRFEGQPPSWIADAWEEIGDVFGNRDFGSDSIEFDDKHVPFGLNWAVHRQTQLEYLYDGELGPRPGSEIRGEETELMRRMLSDGIAGRYVPGAMVEHYIPRCRQSAAYIRAYFAGQGEQFARAGGKRLVPGRMMLGRPVWLWRKLLESYLQYYPSRFTKHPTIWVPKLRTLGLWTGYFNAWPSLECRAGAIER